MSVGYISRLLAKVSSVLDDDNLWNLGITIDWETLSNIYNLDGVVGYYNNGYFYSYEIDILVRNLLSKDFLLFKVVILYIANRYSLPILEEYLDEYDNLFDNDKKINFENSLDADNLKVFISFSNKNGAEALKIHNFFKECGVGDCFLSKTNIKISEEYKNKIYDNILGADIFIYLLSEHSKKSDWCDQEMGMAFMKYKFDKSMIFIVSEDGSIPYGFLSSFNAGFTYNSNYLFDIVRKIDEKLESSLMDNIEKKYVDSLDSKIKELFTVDSYKGAKNLLMFINKRSDFLTEKHLEMICNAAINNNQIYDCIICRNPLNKILSKHKDIIDDDLYMKVFDKINPK